MYSVCHITYWSIGSSPVHTHKGEKLYKGRRVILASNTPAAFPATTASTYEFDDFDIGKVLLS